MSTPDVIRWDWGAYWGNVATLADLQGAAPNGAVSFYRALSELEPDKALDSVEAEILSLSDNALAWGLGGLTRAYALFVSKGAPKPLLEDVNALIERLEDEATSRGLYDVD